MAFNPVVQSLLDISLMKVAVLLFTNFEECVQCLLARREDEFWTYPKLYTECEKCLSNIIRMVAALQLPIELQKRVIALYKHVHCEINAFHGCLKKLHKGLDYMFRCSCVDKMDFTRYFKWNSNGTLNEKKTIEILLKKEDLDIQFRFLLACHFCSEDYVVSLWELMPDVKKSLIPSITGISQPLLSYWLKRLDKKDSAEDVLKVIHSFLWSGDKRNHFQINISSLQYILKHLSANKINEFLYYICLGVSGYPAITRFCFFKLSQEGQQSVFQDNPREILFSFIQWPWQRHFMELAGIILPFMREVDFSAVVIRLSVETVMEKRAFDHVRLLMQFWKLSPEHLKNYMRTEHEESMNRIKEYLKSQYGIHDFY